MGKIVVVMRCKRDHGASLTEAVRELGVSGPAGRPPWNSAQHRGNGDTAGGPHRSTPRWAPHNVPWRPHSCCARWDLPRKWRVCPCFSLEAFIFVHNIMGSFNCLNPGRKLVTWPRLLLSAMTNTVKYQLISLVTVAATHCSYHFWLQSFLWGGKS